MLFERYEINKEDNVYLNCYCYEKYAAIPHKDKRPAVVICPGGGYGHCCEREADPVAMCYTKAGYNTFVLYYTIGEKAVFPTSLIDLCKAMKYVRDNADRFGVNTDEIAVCGFSAGGHLAASLGVFWCDEKIMALSDCQKGENKPNALILIYPVISTSWMENLNQLSRLIGDNDFEETYKKLNLHIHVTKNTPPAFLCHTVADDGVPVEDSIKFGSALINAGVGCEMHLFPNGGHGMSIANDLVCENWCEPSFAQWMDLSQKWLKRLFDNKQEGYAPIKKAEYSSKY